MSVVAFAKKEIGWPGPMCLLYEWVLGAGDTGTPVKLPYNTDVTVQVMAIAGATITWQGTLDEAAAPTVYGTLNKAKDGTALTQVAAGDIQGVVEHPLQYRPSSAGGTATVRLVATKQWKD